MRGDGSCSNERGQGTQNKFSVPKNNEMAKALSHLFLEERKQPQIHLIY